MIDVIIPAYNCSKTLDRALGSLVAQTDKRFKVTIVDDCSTENLLSVVDRYRDILNIGLIRNIKNIGCGMSRQVGIESTHHSYFTFLDSDDVFMPYTVEIYNSVIEVNSSVELIHSFIYKQEVVKGELTLNLIKDGFSYCHGKLYNRELVTKFGIENSPLVRWHDDSYFNSMCTELLKIEVVSIPTVLWCFNSESITRRVDKERDSKKLEDFLKAMCMSKDFVLRHKDTVNHIDATIQNVTKVFSLTEDEQKLLDYLKGE